MSTLTEAAAARHTEAELREALQRIHHVAIGKSDRAYMSIPADPRHDADLVLSAAIDELVELRAKGVDATLDVTAELARVTAERDKLKAEVANLSHHAELQRLEGALAEQARALAVLTEACEVAKADHDARLAKAIEALKKVDEIACRSGPTIGYGEEPPEPLNPDGCELALLARDAIAALQGEQGPGDWAWVRRPDWVSGDAFHACDVERGALQVKLAETQERHRAELRRVAEAVKAACVAAEVARLYGDMDDPARTVDLDAILRGGK